MASGKTILEEENAWLQAKNEEHRRTIEGLVAAGDAILESANDDRERFASSESTKHDALRKLNNQEQYAAELEQTLEELRGKLHEATAHNVEWMQAATNRIEELKNQLVDEADTGDCAGKINTLKGELRVAAEALALGQRNYEAISKELHATTDMLARWKGAADGMQMRLDERDKDLEDEMNAAHPSGGDRVTDVGNSGETVAESAPDADPQSEDGRVWSTKEVNSATLENWERSQKEIEAFATANPTWTDLTKRMKITPKERLLGGSWFGR